jgi:glycosyltransferase involved in cell wall biosynthesis
MKAAGVDRLLQARVIVMAEALGVAVDPGESTASLLEKVVGRVRQDARLDLVWLLWTVVSGAHPTTPEVRSLHRAVVLAADDDEAVAATLETVREAASRRGDWVLPSRIATGALLVDVDFCARREHNTGVQRVVRETARNWVAAGRSVELVARTADGGGYRSLSAQEHARVVDWDAPDRDRVERATPRDVEAIIPWRSRLLIPDVPNADYADSLAALAEHSSTEVHIIGHDAIPLVSADAVDGKERDRFALFLTVLKHAARVYGVSRTAAAEFAGFVRAVRQQGIPGPDVSAIPLGQEFQPPVESRDRETDEPMFLVVGSHEPRKNHEGVLVAAESLWADGERFRLIFVGRGTASAVAEFDTRVERLRGRGRPVEARRSTGDAELAGLYREATAMVFPSLHEGFGLPVAEALSLGTPVVTTDYGSTAEIAADGGCLLVDPRDRAAIANALRRLVNDPDLRADLRAEAAARPRRTWADYADAVWAQFAAGVA